MTFSFLHITDHHLTGSETEYVRGVATRYTLRAVLRHIASNPAAAQADFLVSTGDLVDRPSQAAYYAALAVLNANPDGNSVPGPLHSSAEGLANLPTYLLPGNHDDRDQFYRCLFPGTQPMPLMNVAFHHKGVQFLFLDWGPEVKATANPEMLRFLAQALESGAPTILLSHYQVLPIGVRWLDEFIADEVERFWDVVTGKNVLGICCGHMHVTYQREARGIPVFGLRSTAFQFAEQQEPLACLLPPQYRLVTVNEGRLETQVFDVPL